MSSETGIGTKGVPRAEREAQIVAAAVDEFADHGYAGASVVTIAERAGISKPLVYQYFGSKDGLYVACLHAAVGALVERMTAAQRVEDDSTAARLLTLRTLFDALEPQRSVWRLLHDPSVPIGELTAVAGGYRARMAELAASGSARFLAARGLSAPDDASALGAVWTGLVDALVTWWIAHPDESAAAMSARCTRLMAAVLA